MCNNGSQFIEIKYAVNLSPFLQSLLLLGKKKTFRNSQQTLKNTAIRLSGKTFYFVLQTVQKLSCQTDINIKVGLFKLITLMLHIECGSDLISCVLWNI